MMRMREKIFFLKRMSWLASEGPSDRLMLERVLLMRGEEEEWNGLRRGGKERERDWSRDGSSEQVEGQCTSIYSVDI